jgi:D-hexose-6-phosphate mutarotase
MTVPVAIKNLQAAKVVEHGALTTKVRPKGAKCVIWVGSATPADAKAGVDVRYNPATGAYTAL